jgi:hypothetical protein
MKKIKCYEVVDEWVNEDGTITPNKRIGIISKDRSDGTNTEYGFEPIEGWYPQHALENILKKLKKLNKEN